MRARATKQDFVFVSKEGKQASAVKKVLKPLNMTALKKAIQNAFGIKAAITSLKRENGQSVTDIRDVTAGMKLLVAFAEEAVSAASRLSGRSTNSAASRVSLRSASSQQQQSETETLSMKNARPAKEVPQPELLSESDERVSELPESESEPEPEPEPVVVAPQEIEEENEYEYVEEEEEEEEVNEAERARRLVEAVIPCNDFANDVYEAFEAMLRPDQEILGKLVKLEDAQKARYMKEILGVLEENFMFKSRKDLADVEVMIENAHKFIGEHRFATSEPTSHVIHAAVTGPKRSGKSTMLGIVAEELLLSLIATDAWKHTFVFAIDMEKFAGTFDDLHSFYVSYVKQTFQLLRAQTPIMLQYLNHIETAFTEIVDFVKRPESINLPRRMVQDHTLKSVTDELQRIGMTVVDNWFDASALCQWLTTVFLLPVTISRAFGFTEVVFIVDNFDAAAGTIDPIYPFDDAPGLAFIHEHLKFAMAHCSFVISARDCDIMSELLVATSDSATDLSSDIEYLTVLDTSRNLKWEEYDLWIEFADKRWQLKMDGSFCGGVPLYVTKWNELNAILDRLEQHSEDSYEFEEVTCEAVAYTQKLLATIMDDEYQDTTGKPKIEVASVKRYKKKEKKK